MNNYQTRKGLNSFHFTASRKMWDFTVDYAKNTINLRQLLKVFYFIITRFIFEIIV